jgi:hypothetical protein
MSEEYPFGFDPEDMEEISDMLDYVVGSHIESYVIQFEIPSQGAKRLIEYYEKAIFGDTKSLSICMFEFGKIIEELKEQIIYDEE